jgi:hypothetical protein
LNLSQLLNEQADYDEESDDESEESDSDDEDIRHKVLIKTDYYNADEFLEAIEQNLEETDKLMENLEQQFSQSEVENVVEDMIEYIAVTLGEGANNEINLRFNVERSPPSDEPIFNRRRAKSDAYKLLTRSPVFKKYTIHCISNPLGS